MKSKNFTKKVALNKRTIADLSNEQLNQVKGGCASKPGETSRHTWTYTVHYTNCILCDITVTS